MEEEVLKIITQEQLNQLREIKGFKDDDISFFYKLLEYNSVPKDSLPFNHVLNLFKKELFSVKVFKGLEKAEENYLGIYLDAYRTLGLLNRDEDLLIDIEKDDLKNYHDELSKEFKSEASESVIDSYNNSVEPFKEYNFENEDYKVGLIESVDELDWEGKYMNHCIATYRHIVAGGRYIGFKFFNKKSWERLTLGFTRDNDTLVFDQLKAHSNYPATKESCEMALDFCEKNGIFADPNNHYDLKSLIENNQ